MDGFCIWKPLVSRWRKTLEAINRLRGKESQYANPSETRLSILDTYALKYNVGVQIETIADTPYSPEKGFSFAVIGDMRDNCAVFSKLWKALNKESVDFSFITGDCVRNGWVNEWLNDFLPIVDKHATAPFFPTPGNHDLGSGRREYLRIFGVRDYWFDYGNARFISLDNADGAVTQKQLDWLEGLLKSAENKRTFLFTHIPPVTVPKWSYYGFAENADKFCELLAEYSLTHAFFSHIHAYSTAEYKGVNLTVSGGGGSKLHRRFGDMGNVYHYVLVHVNGDDVSQEVIRYKYGSMIRGQAGHDYCAYPNGETGIRLFLPKKKP